MTSQRLLAEFRREDIEFVPYHGLGLFLKEGVSTMVYPQESDLTVPLRLDRNLPRCFPP